MAKLKDIAKIAGVSISTVSKVLNGSNEIKGETRNKILQIANDVKYGFKADHVRQSGASKVIGVICPELGSNYYIQLVNSISDYITTAGYCLMLGVTGFDAKKEGLLLKEFTKKGVDGIIFITENEKVKQIFENTGQSIPIVMIANETDYENIDYIKIDDSFGVELAVNHLIRLGHKKIAYIGDHLTEGRYTAYRKTMLANGIDTQEKMVIRSALRFEEGGYRAMKELLGGGEVLTAVFAAYDDLAIGAMRASSEAGVNIPDDISIVGFDNVIVAPYLKSGLTTVSNPIKEMADTSVDILLRRINSSDARAVQNIVLKPNLVIRETTAAFL